MFVVLSLIFTAIYGGALWALFASSEITPKSQFTWAVIGGLAYLSALTLLYFANREAKIVAAATPKSEEGEPSGPVFTQRDRATRNGFLGALLLVAVAAVVAFFVMNDPDVESPYRVHILVGATGAFFVVVGAIFWAQARRLDDRNYVFQRATPMPIKLINEHDDVWLDGRIECPHPVTAPYFGRPCGYCWYTESKRETYRDSDGKTRERWVTVRSDKYYARVWLHDGETPRSEVEIDLRKCDFEDLPQEGTRVGNRRYHISYLPITGHACAVGVVTLVGRAPARSATKSAADNPFAVGVDAKGQKHEKLTRLLQRDRRISQAPIPRATTREQRDAPVAAKEFYGTTGSPISTLTADIAAEILPGDETATNGAHDVERSRRVWLLTKHGSVPLLMTTTDRAHWIDGKEATETALRTMSTILLPIGLSEGAWVAGAFLGWFGPGDPLGIWIAAIVGLAIFSPMFFVTTYNRFVALRQRVSNAWAQIDVDLRMRFDLVPNLVEIVKATATHEADLFARIAELRTQAVAGAAAVLDRESALSRTTSRLTVLGEDYPELKSNAAYRQLTADLIALEEKIAHGRDFYNDTVKEYNITIERFPNVLIAGRMGFQSFPYWFA